MKKYFWIYILIVAALILGLLLWRQAKQSSTIQPLPYQTNQSANPPPSIAPPVGEVSPTNTPAKTSLPANKKPDVTNSNRVAEIAGSFVEKKNKPINLYCQFIDQNSNPVSNVKVTFGIERLTAPDPVNMELGAKYSKLERTTDANGRIEIHGEIGDGIGIGTVTKDGYLLSPKAPRGFDPSSGTYENPVIFKLWKEGIKESLISGSHVFGIDPGKIYTLNLLTGKKIEGEAEGDLRILITRPNGVGPRDKFLWSFSLEAIQGGFAEPDASDEFMYTAPESGYQPKIEMQFDPEAPAWVGIVDRQLFLTSRNGQVYGRAQVEIDSIYAVHSAIQISYTINPGNSRNLQP